MNRRVIQPSQLAGEMEGIAIRHGQAGDFEYVQGHIERIEFDVVEP